MHIVNVARVDFIGPKNTVMRFIVTRFFSYSSNFFFDGVRCDDARVGEKSEKKAKEDTVYSMQIHRMGYKPFYLCP